MSHGFDIAIIGGGVIGLALARALAREAARIAVIDAGAEIPPATNAAAGMLAPSFEKGAEALYALSAESLAMWPDFAAAVEEESGIDIDCRLDGMLGVAFDEAEAEALQKNAEALKARGAAADLVSGAEARRLEPALSDKTHAALWALKDGQVDSRKLLAALRIVAQKNDGALFPARLVKAERRGAGFRLSLSTGETFEAEKLVLASGAAATAEGLVEDLPAPPVVPVKGEALALAMPEPLIRCVVRAPGAYLCPKAGGRLVVGATELRGRDDYAVDAAAIEALKTGAAEAVPGAADLAELERWAGLRPGTPDNAPILGRDPRGPEGVFLALGQYRNGILLAPASAALLAREIVGGEAVTDLKPFAPDRFGVGASDHG